MLNHLSTTARGASRWLIVAALLAVPYAQAARDYTVIGDSLSREYSLWLEAYTGFPPDYCNPRNWTELLDDERGGEFQFGELANNLAIPGTKAQDWVDIINSNFLQPELWTAKLILNGALDSADRVIVFIGGNDTDAAYPGIYEGGSDEPLTVTLDQNIKTIVDHVLDRRPEIPVILVAVPHVGIAPHVQDFHPTDPVKTKRVTDALDELNESLRQFALDNSIAFADIYSGTKVLLEDEPYYLGGREFYKEADASACPEYLFAGDGFHPGEAAHAVFTNRILEAINETYGDNLELITQQELLDDILELGYIDHFADWLESFNIFTVDATRDSDGDGVADIVEFAFLMDPATPDSWKLPALAWDAAAGAAKVSWTPNGNTYGQLQIELWYSSNLGNWSQIPAEDWAAEGNSFSWQDSPAAPSTFIRFRVISEKTNF